MHLQGREIVSEATRRSARQLVATALTVLLAKVYGLDLTGLEVFGVAINPAVINGAAFFVIIFQLVTFLIHWGGDYTSLAPWNSSEKVTGMSRWGASSRVYDQIGALDERLEAIEKLAKTITEQMAQGKTEQLLADLQAVKDGLARLHGSAVTFGRFGNFYLFGLYLALPVAVAFAALLWPSPNA